jgi:hypothetical protein
VPGFPGVAVGLALAGFPATIAGFTSVVGFPGVAVAPGFAGFVGVAGG